MREREREREPTVERDGAGRRDERPADWFQGEKEKEYWGK